VHWNRIAIFAIKYTTPKMMKVTVTCPLSPQLWASIGSEGTTLSFGYANLGTSKFSATNLSAMRLVCDY